jgi:hypothetical protein
MSALKLSNPRIHFLQSRGDAFPKPARAVALALALPVAIFDN